MTLQNTEQEAEQDGVTVIANGQKRKNGRWAKGQSGNPEGAAIRKISYEKLDVQALAKSKTRNAVNCLARIMGDQEAPAAARVSAATALLERGWGKAPQHVSVSGSLDHFIADVVRGLDVIEGESKEIKDLPAPDSSDT